MPEQSKTFDKETETILKEPNRNSRGEECNDGSEKVSRRLWQQTQSGRRQNQWAARHIIRNYPVRETRQRKSMQTMGIIRRPNLTIGISEGKERESGLETLFFK